MNTDLPDKSAQNHKMQRYAAFTVLLPLFCLIAIGLFNRVIDPYQIFSADRHALYNDKPALHANMRLHKAYQVRLQKPDSLILGSSKAIQGLPTAHPLFDGQRVYNLAMPLASMKELTFLLRHANTVSPVRHVVLGLDFLSFNTLARTDGPAAGFRPQRLQGHSGTESPMTDYLSALVSLDALRASYQVLRQRRQLAAGNAPADKLTEHRALTGLGGREDAEIRSRLLDGGHHSNTLKIEEFFTNAVYLPSPHRQFSFDNAQENSLHWFEEFLRTLHENNMSASLFISPSHARLNELIDAAGLWSQYEQWRRQMLSISLRVAHDYGDTPYKLLDFSTPGDITTEVFPAIGDSDYHMRYYYESIHFNQQTGALVLDRLKEDREQPDSVITADFGQLLSESNIEAFLQEIRTRQSRFRQDYPTYRQELEDIVQSR